MEAPKVFFTDSENKEYFSLLQYDLKRIFGLDYQTKEVQNPEGGFRMVFWMGDEYPHKFIEYADGVRMGP